MACDYEKESPFCNTYGGLAMKRIDGVMYLEMEGYTGYTLYGPMNGIQTQAFLTLCELQEVTTQKGGK
jgi:hypothetical protein